MAKPKVLPAPPNPEPNKFGSEDDNVKVTKDN